MNKNKHIKLTKKTRILIIIVSILIALFLLIFGLFRISKEYYYKHTDEGRQEKVLLYLEKKYHQEFEVLFINDETVLFNAWIEGKKYIAKCMPKGGDPENDVFDVWIKPTKLLNFSYKGRYAKDNYFGVLIKPECEQLINDIVSKYFDNVEIKLGLDSPNYDPKLTDKSKLSDFLGFDKKNFIRIIIKVQNTNKGDDEILKLVNEMFIELKENGVYGGGWVDYYYLNEDEQEVTNTIRAYTDEV